AHFPEEVCRVLKLPVQDGSIHVYLFPDQTSFDTYLLAFYPEVTKRRALFIKRPSAVLRGQEELQILCFWGGDIAAQLRHELTHATLHGLRLRLPLWLDEGLAMYFEVGSAGALHREALEAWEKEPWQFDLSRYRNCSNQVTWGVAITTKPGPGLIT
ncbi:MAG TPA: hypothetical protein PKA06_07985, partial [Gemmatales bacterium]|nr:hypothetical protein [Gemmatales bacterium]